MNLRNTEKSTGKQSRGRNQYELPSTRKRRVARQRQGLILLILMAAIATGFYVSTQDKTLQEPEIHAVEDPHILQPEISEVPLPQLAVEVRHKTTDHVVATGETITSLLGQYFTPAEILIIDRNSEPIFPLRKLRAGHQYRIELENEEFILFKYDINPEEQLIIEKKNDEINIERKTIPYNIEAKNTGTQFESPLD
ncbi:MAG: hypothetical protein RBR43_02960 [Desulfuromonadaceae bacterium]|nr:hypothetical protein [Desulfuromonas sp.]MDY0184824.1 hypothetical protein [Desulfuromonadaceae bacterium]